MKLLKTIALISTALLALAAARAILVEPYLVEETRISFDAQNYQGHAITIVHLSDVHAAYRDAEYFSQIEEIVKLANPDIIVTTGDITNGAEEDIAAIAPLTSLNAKYGQYATLGNHDYIRWGCPPRAEWLGYAARLSQKLGEGNVTVLENNNRIINIEGNPLAIAGMDDAWVCRDDQASAIKGIGNKTPIILLLHEPTALDPKAIPAGTLALAGHTHCGQIKIPFVTKAIAEFMGFGDKLGGFVPLGDSGLFVSCGVTPGRMRFNTPPQVAVITIE